MTTQPTANTLFEVYGADYVTVAYFETGDEARAFAATIPGGLVQIYLGAGAPR